jgi:uncharacterized membrane protein
MKSKSILFIALFTLTLLAVNTAMAASNMTMSWNTAASDLYQGQNKTVSYTINNTGDTNLTLSIFLAISGTDLNSSDSIINLLANNSVTREYTILTNDASNIGSHTVSVSAIGNVNASISSAFNILYPYCEINSTKTPVKLVEITNDEKITDDEYNPLDVLTIKVKVQNIDDEEDADAIISAVLVKDDAEVDDTDIEKKVSIDKDDTDTVTVNMTIPSDIDEGTYYLYVKVYNDDKESNCMQQVLPITIEKKSRELIFSNIKFPATVSCGSTTAITGSIINIGNRDEDKVKVVYSDDFGTTSTQIINSLDSGDKSSVAFSLKAPKNATEGEYSASFDVYYDYDEDDEEYGDQSDQIVYLFKTSGSCQQLIETQTITTEASTAIVGTESEVRVTITNTGTVSQTYSVSADADWADINSITPSSAVLAAGESKEVVIKLNAKSSTDIGAHQMLVNVQHGGISESRTVDVSVQKSSAPSGIIDQLKFQLKFNPTWVIIDAALVLAIIIVIISLLAGKKSA